MGTFWTHAKDEGGGKKHYKPLDNAHFACGHCCKQDRYTLNETLYSFWELKSMGVHVEQPGQNVLSDFQEKVKFKNGRYMMSLPWRDVHPPLPDNYQLALKRPASSAATACALEGA